MRNNRRLARAVREESEAESQKQKETIGQALAAAKEDGFPTGVEEKEAFFLANISKGETLSDQGMSLCPQLLLLLLLAMWLTGMQVVLVISRRRFRSTKH